MSRQLSISDIRTIDRLMGEHREWRPFVDRLLEINAAHSMAMRIVGGISNDDELRAGLMDDLSRTSDGGCEARYLC